MSTRALVGIVQDNGHVKYRFVRSDGYLEGTGKELLESYSTLEQIETLYDGKESTTSSPYFTSGVYEVDSEEAFTTAENHIDYHYLYKDGNWYYGHFWYWDGWTISLDTFEKVEKVQEPELRTDGKGWRLLKDRFIITEYVMRDYALIEEDEDDID